MSAGNPEARLKSWHLLAIAALLLGAGIVGDVVIQGTTDHSQVKVDNVDLKNDTATLHFESSFGDRMLKVAREQHLALIAGGLAAWGPAAAVWRRRRKST